MRLNENIMKLEQNYLFAEIAMRVRRFREEHPEAEILSLGINDVTRPLAPAVSAAMSAAAAEMRDAAHFHGYGDVQGEAFLREAVCGYYRSFKVRIGPEDVFIFFQGPDRAGGCVHQRRRQERPCQSLRPVCTGQYRASAESGLSGLL